MDLGGGSTQLSWMLSRHGEISTAESAVSMPFGAAALTKKLATAINDSAINAIAKNIQDELKKAVETLNLPDELKEKADKEGGYTLYLSGGGFRGFGYLLLAEHEIQPYPLAIINGFSAKREHFYKLAQRIGLNLTPAQLEELESTFRISERRARQVPAVAFLIRQLLLSLPQIKDVVFCQGGVREGCLYEKLSPEVRSKNPLTVSTEPYKPPSSSTILNLINDAPPPSTPEVFWLEITPAIANLWTYHAGTPKESRATAGLHFTTTGALASTHGLTHKERALLGLTLCARWGGEIAETTFKERLEKLVGDEMAWWARYVGAVAQAIGMVFPAGIVLDYKGDQIGSPISPASPGDDSSGGRRRRLSEVDGKISFFARDQERKEHLDIVLRVRVVNGDPDTGAIMVKKAVEDVEKVGKKKNCGKGFRRKVVVFWETVDG
ncbi:hypothetical protein ABW19_dt0210478 [Dactylella cylindrospora]|nr:hypothetical protein ABW19_dt0210478 [Dactylella cylindrospora]